MPVPIQYLAAAAVLVAGVIKAAVHMTAVTALSIPTCLGSSHTLTLQTSFWERAHCWGCYAALAGAVWLTVLVALSLPRRRARLLRAQ